MLITLLLAWFGPMLAQHDPRTPSYIVWNPRTATFVKPPFAPLLVPGFPLGTDTLGRDLLSRLLWALRPTLTVVFFAATLRLCLGLLVGLAAGWSSRRWAQIFDSVIAVALTVPVLLVALFTVAALGIQWGVWAFILGLTLTAWADVARVIGEQTRIVRGQPYIEAARALGASSRELILRHVLPQVLGLIWMLLAFEISGALLVTAGLGFLGYYVNAIWVPLGDWSAMRTSGQPELGQMLASGSEVVLQQPWELLVAATMITSIVLAFHLLGEGLRQWSGSTAQRQTRATVERARRQVGRHLPPAAHLPAPLRRPGFSTAAVALLLLIALVGGAVALWRAQRTQPQQIAVTVPGGHQWASAHHDAQGTVWTPVPGPAEADLLWTVRDESGFAGGPAVAHDGTIFIAAPGGTLYAFDHDGNETWRQSLPDRPVGSPALAADGSIYLLSRNGTLMAAAPDGTMRWLAPAVERDNALAGPVVDAQNFIYIGLNNHLRSFTAEGTLRWEQKIPTYSYVQPQIRLDNSAQHLFFEDTIGRTVDGKAQFAETREPLDKYIVGVDGRPYLLTASAIYATAITADGVTFTPYIRWDTLELGTGFRIPLDAGLLPDGRAWIFFAGPYEVGKFLWLETTGAVTAVVNVPWVQGSSQLIGLDSQSTVYLCGLRQLASNNRFTECRAYRDGQSRALWTTELPGTTAPVGGAVVAGRLYVATADGTLAAIGAE